MSDVWPRSTLKLPDFFGGHGLEVGSGEGSGNWTTIAGLLREEVLWKRKYS